MSDKRIRTDVWLVQDGTGFGASREGSLRVRKLKYDNLPKVSALRINPGTDQIVITFLDHRNRTFQGNCRLRHREAMILTHLAATHKIYPKKFVHAEMLHAGEPVELNKYIYTLRGQIAREWNCQIPIISDGHHSWMLDVDPEEIRFKTEDLERCDNELVKRLILLALEGDKKELASSDESTK